MALISSQRCLRAAADYVNGARNAHRHTLTILCTRTSRLSASAVHLARRNPTSGSPNKGCDCQWPDEHFNCQVTATLLSERASRRASALTSELAAPAMISLNDD